jgi:hypothetical protein
MPTSIRCHSDPIAGPMMAAIHALTMCRARH